MKIKDMLITNNRAYKKINPKGVVIHWTANTNVGADAIANRNYFQNHPKAQVSAHYIVDDKNIIRCVPENEIAWHVGSRKYTDLKYKLFGNDSPNKYLIGIEMCVNSDGNWDKTYQNTVELIADILKRYGWGIDKILRHFDLVGKNCPNMMTPYVKGGEEYFQEFKNEVRGFDDMDLLQWQKDLGVKAIDNLANKNLLSNPQDWKNKLDENTPNWLFFEMINRLVESKK